MRIIHGSIALVLLLAGLAFLSFVSGQVTQGSRAGVAGEPLAGRRGASGADGLLPCDRQHGQSCVTGEPTSTSREG
jgi:hypothetical protein